MYYYKKHEEANMWSVFFRNEGETLSTWIAVCDTAEKAHFLVTAANYFRANAEI